MRTFEDANPLALAVYFLAVSGISMFCMNPILLLLSLTGSVLYYFVKNGRKGLKSHLWSLGLFLVLIVLNPLVSHNGVTVLFVLNHNPVTLEALIYGIAAAGKILAVLDWFRSFTEIMTSDKLLYLFGRFSPKLALVLSMGLRYVPLFTRQAQKIGQTQTALGLYKDDNLIDRFRGGMRIFDVLVTWGLENGIVTADSMTARGYGVGKRSHFSIFRFRRSDILLFTLTLLLFGVTVCSIGSGAMDFTYYPAIRPAGYSHTALAGYLAYGILILIPTILEAEETIKWSFLQSKI